MSFLFQLIKRTFATAPDELAEKLKRGWKHYVLNRPTLVLVQTVSACNLQCRHCFINNYGKEIKDGVKKILTADEFKKMLPSLRKAIKHAELFELTTFEPLLQKHIFEIFDIVLAINPKIKFPILTNAMLVNEGIMQKLRKYPISEFTISFDGAKRETVESFKTGADFEKIISVMKLFNSLKFDVPLQTVFVLQKNNYKELPEYIDFVNSLGVKTVFVNNLLSFTPETNDLTLYSKAGNDEVEEIFEQAIKKVEKNRQTLYLPSMKPIEMGCKTTELLFVDINGNVPPCDYLAVETPFEYDGKSYKAKPLIFGNIFKNDALKIFRSTKAKEFRNFHRLKQIPECCRCCINAYGLMCSNRRKYGI